MNQAALRDATYEDLLQVPEPLVAEIINGRLVTRPRPAPRQVRASTRLGGEFDGPFDQGHGGPGGWWILDEPELHLGGEVLVPDLAGWRRERMPRLPETAWFELAPDWVCEVLSPGTARIDRAEKMPAYAAVGVGYCWLIDPLVRTLEVFALHEGHWLLLGVRADADLIALPPFDAVSFDLSALWAD
ncbi:MAG TPA: Uma2 family endonuclease [Lamprocystis sp. (in: g-proteobacteria)]|nr:Uma2 family endonuclease [Lamprocystis sp. (in: g-proteobacteria)]